MKKIKKGMWVRSTDSLRSAPKDFVGKVIDGPKDDGNEDFKNAYLVRTESVITGLKNPSFANSGRGWWYRSDQLEVIDIEQLKSELLKARLEFEREMI